MPPLDSDVINNDLFKSQAQMRTRKTLSSLSFQLENTLTKQKKKTITPTGKDLDTKQVFKAQIRLDLWQVAINGPSQIIDMTAKTGGGGYFFLCC